MERKWSRVERARDTMVLPTATPWRPRLSLPARAVARVGVSLSSQYLTQAAYQSAVGMADGCTVPAPAADAPARGTMKRLFRPPLHPTILTIFFGVRASHGCKPCRQCTPLHPCPTTRQQSNRQSGCHDVAGWIASWGQVCGWEVQRAGRHTARESMARSMLCTRQRP